jgi:hypothetical protein
MQFKPKKWTIISGIIFIILLFTNPSIQRFRDFLGERTYEGLRRKMNFMVFSIYEDDGSNKYIGVLYNFIPITKSNRNYSIDNNPTYNHIDYRQIADSSIKIDYQNNATTNKYDFNRAFDESVGKNTRNKKKDSIDFNKAFDEAVKPTTK